MATAKNIEYEDAPSGHVTFYNYKEPLMRFDEGYGFVGAVVFDGESDKLQCHFCGEWYDSIGHHLRREHNLTAAQYKEATGLNKSTALINEKYRAKLIKAGQDRFKNIRPNTGHTEETRRKISETVRRGSMEKANRLGTCPEQLIDRLIKLHNRLGRTPKEREIPFGETLRKVYGSMEEACSVAGIPYRQPGKTVDTGFITEEEFIESVLEFKREHGKFPLAKDLSQSPLRRYGGIKEVIKKALLKEGRFVPAVRNYSMKYTPAELLHFLRVFEKIHGRKPSYSDAKRRLIPHLSRYSYHFGSWQNALKQAGI